MQGRGGLDGVDEGVWSGAGVSGLGVGELAAEPGDRAGAVGRGQRVEGDVHAAVDELDVGGFGEGFA